MSYFNLNMGHFGRAQISDNNIRKAARSSRSLTSFAYNAGYDNWSLGTNSRRRIKRVIGESCFNEICSGSRSKNAKRNWTKPMTAKAHKALVRS